MYQAPESQQDCADILRLNLLRPHATAFCCWKVLLQKGRSRAHPLGKSCWAHNSLGGFSAGSPLPHGSPTTGNREHVHVLRRNNQKDVFAAV